MYHRCYNNGKSQKYRPRSTLQITKLHLIYRGFQTERYKIKKCHQREKLLKAALINMFILKQLQGTFIFVDPVD